MNFEAPKLFCGIELNQKISRFLNERPESERSLFIREGDEYLQEVSYHNIPYLGKKLGSTITTKELDLLRNNICSLINRLAPESDCENLPFELFPIEK